MCLQESLQLLLRPHVVALVLGDGGHLDVCRAELLLHDLLQNLQNCLQRFINGDGLKKEKQL